MAKAKKAAKARTKTVKPKVLPNDTAVRYAGDPTAVVYDKIGKGRKALKQLLWGDWMVVVGEEKDGHLPVKSRGCTGFIDAKLAMTQRVLEVIFVDIGQGDGCLLVTPDDKHLLIDAGQGDNMHRFLRWRYGRFQKEFAFEAAILLHSDIDHYGGFGRLFDEPKLHFKNVYTNGLMERPSAKDDGTLGPRRKVGTAEYIDALVPDKARLTKFVAKKANVGSKQYPAMLKKALDAGKFDEFRMLSVADKHLPGFGPDNKVTIEVLGPVAETVKGKRALRWFEDDGKTKNGHSVVLRLKIGGVSILLGGDLNIPSEALLLEAHAFRSPQIRALLPKGSGATSRRRATTEAPTSPTSSSEPLNPIATIDLERRRRAACASPAGCARYLRAMRPRQAAAHLQHRASPVGRRAHQAPVGAAQARRRTDEVLGGRPDGCGQEEATAKADKFKAQLDRSVATYGAINLRTDGSKAVVAQKIEKARGKNKEWDGYQFEPKDGELAFISKFEDDEDADE